MINVLATQVFTPIDITDSDAWHDLQDANAAASEVQKKFDELDQKIETELDDIVALFEKELAKLED